MPTVSQRERLMASQLLDYLMLSTYAYLDEASGQVKKTGKTSRSAIVVLSQDPWGRCFVLYTWAGRVKPTDIVDQVVQAHVRFHPKMFGIESNGQQNLFAQLLTELIHRKGIRDFAPVYVRPPLDKTKTERIKNAVQPYMKSGRLFLQEYAHADLKREIDTFPTGLTNDLIDALAGCIAMIPPVYEPRPETTTQDAIKSYLRAMGISEAEIHAAPGLFTSYPTGDPRLSSSPHRLFDHEDPLLKITRSRFAPR